MGNGDEIDTHQAFACKLRIALLRHQPEIGLIFRQSVRRFTSDDLAEPDTHMGIALLKGLEHIKQQMFGQRRIDHQIDA